MSRSDVNAGKTGRRETMEHAGSVAEWSIAPVLLNAAGVAPEFLSRSDVNAGKTGRRETMEHAGSVAEWSIAPVLKTGSPQGLVSSNLTASARTPPSAQWHHVHQVGVEGQHQPPPGFGQAAPWAGQRQAQARAGGGVEGGVPARRRGLELGAECAVRRPLRRLVAPYRLLRSGCAPVDAKRAVAGA